MFPIRTQSKSGGGKGSGGSPWPGDAPRWILNEPFTVLDAAVVDLLQRLIPDHAANGGLLVLTTSQVLPSGFPLDPNVILRLIVPGTGI